MEITQESKRTKLYNNVEGFEFPIEIWTQHIVPYLFEYSAKEIDNFNDERDLSVKECKSGFAVFLEVTSRNSKLWKLRFKYLPYHSVLATKFTHKVGNKLSQIVTSS
jgi:hypothetical protein